MSLDQAFPQSAPDPEPRLDAGHSACVVLVIIAKKVQQAVQCQHAQFRLKPVSRVARLTPRHAQPNHDISDVTGIVIREGKHVRYTVFASVTPVERANSRISNEHHGHGAARSDGSQRRKPSGQSRRTDAPAGHHLDREGGPR
jgi:hypothetical protein